MRDWLPRTYEVVTKGRIISQEGVTSPQIDVLVLKGAYPKKLLNKKLYLAAGVAAAFECKVTLKASHIAAAMENCTKIKSLYRTSTGTPYKELHSPLVYGVLAHSHGWKGRASTPEVNIEQKLREVDALHITHPRLQLDLLCIADLAAWTSSKMTFLGPRQIQNWATMVAIYGPNGSATSGYIGFTRTHGQQVIQFTPIGVLISFLSQKLAWEVLCFVISLTTTGSRILPDRVWGTCELGPVRSTVMRYVLAWRRANCQMVNRGMKGPLHSNERSQSKVV